MKHSAAHIEMYVSRLKIRGNGFTDSHFRLKMFYFAPGNITDTFTVDIRLKKENLKVTSVSFYFKQSHHLQDDHLA